MKHKFKKANSENNIYASIIGYCEELEHEGIYKGNGHHLAQKLTTLVSEALLSEQQNSVYKVLKTTPQSAKEIGLLCDLPSKDVSAVLNQLSKTTTLISWKLWVSPKSQIVTKRKLYYKR